MPAIHIIVALLLSLDFAGCAIAADERKLHEGKGDAKTQKPIAPRRAVPMVIERPPAATPPAPSTTVPAVPQSTVPQGPSPITGCDPGGCWSGGNRYEGGAGGTYLDRGGRLCQGNGTWMQCF
jgi:hypothetical protein